MYTTDNRHRIRLAIISTTPPRPCPIATYTDTLCHTLPTIAPRICLTVYAIDHGDGRPTTAGRPAAGSIDADDPSAYRRAAQRLHRLGTDVTLIEVGPGTAGGPHGRYLLGLTDELTRIGIPYLLAPHHVRPSPPPDDAATLSALCRESAGVVVASNSARQALAASRIAPPRRVAVVPPGPTPELRTHFDAGPRPAVLTGCRSGPVLTTMGHMSPTRGIEVAVAALPALAATYPDIHYVVAGRSLPSQDPDRYHRAVTGAARALGVADRLTLLDRDVPVIEAAALLRATDVYVAPDLDTGRTDDGPLADAVALGLRIVATQTPYATELVGERPGATVPPGDPNLLAAAIERVLTGPAPTPSDRSFIHTAKQIAGLVALVASPRPVSTHRARAAGRRTAA